MMDLNADWLLNAGSCLS